ncbi:MAG: phage tail protein [Novosphingobium sp.]
MNVNGSRFHMMLGMADWGRCTAGGTALQEAWDDRANPLMTDAIDPAIAGWDAASARLTLARLPEALLPTPGEAALTAAGRRAAAADRHGNLYVLSADRSGIEVIGALQRQAAAFWPDPRYRPAPSGRAFEPIDPPRAELLTFTALAVTASDYLVVGFQSASGPGLLRFDLAAGGEPGVHRLGELIGGAVADLASDGCGGVFLLDAAGRRVLRLNGALQPVTASEPIGEDDSFQPDGPIDRRRHLPAASPLALSVPASLVPLQLVAGRPGEAILLAARPGGGSAVLAIDQDASAMRHIADDPRDWIMAARLEDADELLLVVPPSGNQAFAFAILRDAGKLTGLADRATLLPMRRFGGRALVLRGKVAVYESGDPAAWIPLVGQPRRRFAELNRFDTVVFDGGEPQCLWDRIRLDACIPPGTSVRIWARAGDDPLLLDADGDEGWIEQPRPYLNGDGGELPGKRHNAMLLTDRARGTGCWDLLLQNVVGRLVRLRIELAGDGRNSPMLRALRLWYPRFSYNARFLPAVYREDPGPADFLDRFLANMEGLNTVLEGRIAAAQVLLDPRTARAETLDWLASWFDIMLDPSWGEDRRRLFLRHVTAFLGWRGTRAGLAMALRLAFDECLTDRDFTFGGTQPEGPGQIRIVEHFSIVPTGRRVVGGAPSNEGPSTTPLGLPWQPAEGAAGVYARAGFSDGGRFPLFARDDIGAAVVGVAQQAFGFTPQAGALERQGWQAYQLARTGDVEHPDLPRGDVAPAIAELWSGYLALHSATRSAWQIFLERRYQRIGALRTAYGAGWDGFDEIPLPDYLPDRETAIRDWLLFEGQVLPRRRAAHRFSVLLPLRNVSRGTAELDAEMALARRIVELEKPAHTEGDVRFYWAMNRLGEARLGRDTELGPGSRSPDLIPPAILGRTYLGSSFVGGQQSRVSGRERLAC